MTSLYRSLSRALALALPALAACSDDATGPSGPTGPAACTLECATPPEASCADASTLRVFSSEGRCEDAACTYPHVDLPCALGCDDGACLGDPCAGVTCTTPPDACHVDQGVCQSGVCTYALADGKACDDGDACSDDDRCAAGSCAGQAIACTTPPTATCADADHVVAYVASGTCDAGACTYESRVVACPPATGGCVDGACLGDPCAGVVCNAPPSPCHDAVGTCSNGLCQYAFDDGAACDDDDACTTGDKCQAGTCGGTAIACATPPAATCADGDTLVVASATGTCDGGACTYDTDEVACDFGCANGGCVGDPCAGVTCNTPAPATCTDANTLSTPAATGTCHGGACQYAATSSTCPYGCAAGKCTAPVGYVISEVLYDSEGFPDSDAFVELHGPANAPLTGVTLVGVNGNGGGDYATIALAGTFDASGLFVVAHPDAAPGIAAFADVTATAVDFQNGPDTVQLRYGATVLDALAYGDFTASDVMRGEGEPHPGAAPGESLARDKDFRDSNDNAADFSAAATTPGVGPRTCEDACEVPDATQCDGAATVVTCDDGDGDGCLEWTAPTACDGGRHCDGGGCVCDAGCGALGDTECADGAVRTCVSVGGCPVWSAPQACESGTCADDGACFDAPDLVITTNRELCGVQVVDELIVQGGAKVTCSTGELRVHARTVFVDPASSIDLSASSSAASGGAYGFCADGQLNEAATGGGGGGNGTRGDTAASVTWEKEVREPGCGGGPQCYDLFCVECTGGNGGAVRGSSVNLELSGGGRGGNGCYDWTTSSPGSYFHVCDPNEPEPPGGKGGGALELVADESITILGALRATGQNGQPSTSGPSPMTGSGGGAGGTIVLRAPTIEVAGEIDTSGGLGLVVGARSEGCGNEQVSGANGGNGRLKVAYGESFELSGVVTGAVQSVSYTPPTEFTVAVDGEDAPAGPVVVNDTFTSITFRWARPFADATGFWYRLSQDGNAAVSAANGTYTAATEVTIPRASFTAPGEWYLHVISVDGPSVTIGTLSDRASITLNTAPPLVSSQSHPNPNAWVAGTTIVAAWTSPTGSDADFARYHYRLDRNSQSTWAATGWTATTGKNVLLTSDADGHAIDAFAYYLHVVAEDRFGHIGSQVAHYRVQIGTEPATTTFYGYVHDANGDPLVGATLRLEPFARVQTTQVAGYFIFEGLYVGAYTAYVTPAAGAAGSFVVGDVTVTPTASPMTLEP